MPDFSQKDACELLDADHIAVKHLFVDYARLALAPDADATAQQRTTLARKICDELTVHAQIEEEIFYPALRETQPEADEEIGQAYAEHQEAKQLIADIRALGQANPEMDALVAKLNVAIEHHVKQERDALFPVAKASPDLDLQALAQQMQQRQQELEAPAARDA
jgi:iron-sulfur cluster repair protein YtfE (RIC family)